MGFKSARYPRNAIQVLFVRIARGVVAVMLLLTACTSLPDLGDGAAGFGNPSYQRAESKSLTRDGVIQSDRTARPGGWQPLIFIPDAAGADTLERYLAYTPIGNLFFSRKEVLFTLVSTLPGGASSGEQKPVNLIPIRIKFIGVNPFHDLRGVNPLDGTINVMQGVDPARWRSGLPAFTSMAYEGLYPGIDLFYDGVNGRVGLGLSLKGTYHVAPGADPGQIRWRYDGPVNLRLDPNGDLRAVLSEGGKGKAPGMLLERKPLAWQEIDGERIPVQADYEFAGDGSVGFRLGEFDPDHPLIIDPTLEYSTFLGGAGLDEAVAVAVDGARNAIVVGATVSVDYPSDIPLPEALIGNRNVFVTKFSSDGSRQEFSTILGGTADEYSRGVIVDSAGEIYLTGLTFSTDFPVTLSGQIPDDESGGNIFIVKLSLSGGSLRYSTVVGGRGEDEAFDIAVDSGGSAYVGGFTDSEDFPIRNPLQSTFGGGEGDGFLIRLNAVGNEILYSSYLGGSASDSVIGVAVDRRGNAYLTGFTDSIDFPTVRALQESLGGVQDSFLTKLDEDLAEILFSTYLGIGIASVGNGVIPDRDGNAYLVGTMERTEAEGRGGSDVYVLRLSEDGENLDINIVLGGNGDEEGKGIGLDREQNVYVTGYTESTDLPNAGSFQASYGGSGDAFLAQLNPAGELVAYNYLGGSNFDVGNAIAISGSGDGVVAGVTFSADFPTVNAYQSVNRGEGDAFVLKIEEVKFVPTPAPTATAEPTLPPPTATPVPTALEGIIESDNFLYGLLGLMGFIFLLMVIEVIRGGRRG